jgi:hypothetical protein
LFIDDDLTFTSDSAVITFGADGDTTLTHTDGTGLTLNSTNKLTFGDAASFVQQSSDGVLRIDGEATIDLNASTAVTVSNDLKLDSDSAVLGFGADNDTTLTHTDGSGLTLNSTNKIMFNDASQFIQGSSATVLSLGATDEIDLTATLIDINGNADVTGTVTATKLVSADGVLELDDNGTHNGIINSPASLIINIDSDSNSTGEDFIIAKDRTSTSGGTELFRVQEDGNVGIGTSSPSSRIHIQNDSDTDYTATNFCTAPSATISNTTSGALNYASLLFSTEANGEFAIGAVQNSGNTASDFVFASRTSGTRTERMRIDSSGNLLVGTTSSQSGIAKAAVEFDSASQYGLEIKDGGTGTIGTFAIFYKGTSPVGSIGTGSGGLFIGSSSQTSGISCFGTALYPNAGSSISATDGANDLGAPTARWKDLYLSGGAYIGGTGAANKLDDYEEGTWTPTDASGAGLTITVNASSYTKIGNLCYIYAYITYPNTSSTAAQTLGGLPFVTKSSNTYAQLTVRVVDDTVSENNLTFQTTTNSFVGSIHDGTTPIANVDLSGTAILISGVYATA